jgi:antitoxin (DNA-binding transcriptional repressor) of toxin-antitoxin stability system
LLSNCESSNLCSEGAMSIKIEEFMEITTKQLGIQPEKIISQVNNGQEITITHRGKAFAKIVPLNVESLKQDSDNKLFGLWKNRKDIDDVNQYVRKMRKRKSLC